MHCGGKFSTVVEIFLLVSSVQRYPFYFTNWEFIGDIFCLVDRNIGHVYLFSMIFRVILADTVPLLVAGGSHCSLALGLATSRHLFLFSIKVRLSGKEFTCQCKRWGFDSWVRKTPWSRKWQPTPVFLPEKSHG